jgi:DivIVA domain-containing protein
VPIKPEEINASKLPVGVRGYQRQAVDEFLLRIAWDYRQATRAHEGWAKDEKWLKDRVAELEAELASRDEHFARLQEAQRERFRQELHERSGPLLDELNRLRESAKENAGHEELTAEVTRLRAAVAEHESREELTRALLATAQRTARELRLSTRAECESLLKAAHRRAAEIERDAHRSVKHSAAEIERLRQVEENLKAQLRRTLELVLASELPGPRESEQQAPPVAVD